MPTNPLALGPLARCFYMVSAHEVERAAEMMAAGASSIGAALVTLGAITAEQLDALLTRQAALKSGEAHPCDVRALVDFAIAGTLSVGERMGQVYKGVRERLEGETPDSAELH